MPLEILLILVIGGIAGIAVLLHLMGHSRRDPFTEDSAAAAWLRQEPDRPPRRVHLSGDGLAALIETDEGLGLVWLMGVDSTAHRLDRPRLRATRDGLRIGLGDFAAPSVRLRLSPEAARDWADRIAAASRMTGGRAA